MHPNKSFDWTDTGAMLRFVSEQGFAHIFTASEAGLFVAHAPVLVTNTGRVQFHVSRRNRIAEHVAGHRMLVSVMGREAYQSANWYVSDNQVPTWLYEVVEIEGAARTLETSELVELLDRLSEEFENRHSPEKPWTRAKMTPGAFEAMTKAIIGFEIDPDEIRGTRKFNQHKRGDDLVATVKGQLGAGREDVVEAIGEVNPPA